MIFTSSTDWQKQLAPYLQRRLPYNLLAIGGSAGSFPIVNQLLAALPEDYHLPVVLCLHRLKDKREGFVEALSIRSGLPVCEPDDKQPIQGGMVYIAPANYHLLVEPGHRFSLSTAPLVQFSRPSIDVLLESVGDVYGEHATGIILSGANKDGAAGLAHMHRRACFTLVQNPADAAMPTMPKAAEPFAHASLDLNAITECCQLLDKVGR